MPRDPATGPPPPDDSPPPGSFPVHPFAEVNKRLWGIPRAPAPHRRGRTAEGSAEAAEADDDARTRFLRDFEAVEASMVPAPDEANGFASHYLYTWMEPLLRLAYKETLSEDNLPLPRRSHRARLCGARVSAAFREEEVLRGREAWSRCVEATAEGGALKSGTTVNPLSEVAFRGEPLVKGRLRWVGYLRASDTPRRLYAGVEWNEDSPVPSYRAAMLADPAWAQHAGGILHDGCVHGERLFHQRSGTSPRCSCERVEDVELVSACTGATGLIAANGKPRRPRTPSLAWVLLRTFRSDLLAILPPALYFSICQLCNPILLQHFVGFLSSSRSQDGLTHGIVLVAILAFQKLTGPVAGKKDLHRSERVACLFQSTTLALIFEKCLTISPAALADPEMSAGRILTMASSDVENIRTFATDILYVFLAPFELIFYIAYLYSLLGWCALAALFAFAISIPVQGLVAKAQDDIQERLSACIDRRLRRTNELLGGIRIVKTMGWESRFLHSIEARARKAEQRERRRLQWTYCLSLLFVDGTSSVMACAVMFAYVLSGHSVTASVAFPVISIIGSVGFPLMMLPESITSLIKYLVSCRRVSRFLECDDEAMTVRDVQDCFSERKDDGASKGADSTIVFSGVSVFAWAVKKLKALPRSKPAADTGLAGVVRSARDAVLRRRFPPELEWEDEVPTQPTTPDATAVEKAMEKENVTERPTGDTDDTNRAHAMVHKTLLHNMDLRIPTGKLTVIIGATGSGKSTVLTAVLGSLGFEQSTDTLLGEECGVWASRDLAYVPQQPWIMQDSIRANITFFEDVARAESNRRLPAKRLGGACYPRSVVCSPLWRRRGRGGRPIVHVPPSREEQEQDARIAAAIRCCQLEPDLRDLADGVDTEIGEKGVNLSGGQKARIGLARAVYADRTVYLLDDPLSAVDAHVGRRLMRDVVLGALKDKTRVLVTHQVSVLPEADMVVVMRGGRVQFTGSYTAYAASPWREALEQDLEKENGGCDGGMDADLVDDFSPPASPSGARADGGTDSTTGARPFPERAEADASRGRNNAQSDESDGWSDSERGEEVEGKANGGRPGAAGGDTGPRAATLIIAEEKETGHVPWSVYRGFIEAGGGPGALAIIFALFVENTIVYFLWSVWLSLWSTTYFPALSQGGCLAVYLLLAALLLSTHPVRNLLLFAFVRRACGRLHESLLHSVTSATVAFFDQTPLGRIVNRFSKDFNVLDDSMTMPLTLLVEIVSFVLGSLLLTSFSAPGVLPVIAIAAFVFWRLLRYYTTIIREIRRRASIAQSPMFSLLEEITTGRESIDAYGKAHIVFEEALSRLDKLYCTRYIEKVVTIWLAVRIEFLISGIMITVSLAGLLEKTFSTHDVLPSGRVGLLSLALTMSMDLFWTAAGCIEFFAILEANMNSAQRVFHYIDMVPHEDLMLAPHHGLLITASPRETKGERDATRSVAVTVDDGAAQQAERADGFGAGAAAGSLEFRHVDMRYRPGLPLVLRDVSFCIAPREKIGVVGRTGSGKSTLLQTFMRLVEVSGGLVLVDGQPAAQLPLPSLRRRFAMIPQDPVLFEGSVRSNLDPFNESSDEEVRRALQLVGLIASSQASPAPPLSANSHGNAAPLPSTDVALGDSVAEGGKNFSVGQRQLLCLARALLKKGSEFILMDEATANIDPVLDRQVQEVVRQQFRDYTVITIAHRLHTVAGYDRVFVMEQGRLVESGPPRLLVQDRGSVFRRLVGQMATRKKGGAADAEDASEGGSPTSARERRETAAIEAFLRLCKPES